MRYLVVILLSITLVSCNTSEEKSILDSTFLKHVTTQSFIIQGDSLNSFRTDKGVIIELMKSQVLNPNNGTLRVEVTEVFDKASMIFSKLSTNTIDGQLLESKGMLKIQIFSGESTTDLKKDEKYMIKIPRAKGLYDYEVYYGRSNDNYVEWENSGINRIDTLKYETSKEINLDVSFGDMVYKKNGVETFTYYITGTDTVFQNRKMQYPKDYPIEVAVDMDSTSSRLNEYAYFMFEPLNLDWINIDKLIETDSVAPLILRSDTSLFQQHFLIFKNRNSVLSSFGKTNLSYERLPLNEELQLISIASKEDELLYSSISFTLVAAKEVDIKFKSTTESELEVLIKSVNEKGS